MKITETDKEKAFELLAELYRAYTEGKPMLDSIEVENMVQRHFAAYRELIESMPRQTPTSRPTAADFARWVEYRRELEAARKAQ